MLVKFVGVFFSLKTPLHRFKWNRNGYLETLINIISFDN